MPDHSSRATGETRLRARLSGRRPGWPPASCRPSKSTLQGVKPDEPEESGGDSITPFKRGTITCGLSSGLAV